MKKIYIILTNSGTILSRVIKLYTRKEYTHVSISLDKRLRKMYSFGRLNPYNPFIGGFVHESKNHGTFKRFVNTTTCIYSIEVEDEQYDKIKQAIKEVKKQRRKYKFNILGLFAVALHLKIKTKDSFYCAEFVKEVLQRANMASGLPNIIKPEDFKYLENMNIEYKGMLRDYNILDNIGA